MARFFDVTKPGKGVSKEDVANKKGMTLYLEIFFKRFWKMVVLNLIFLIASVPAIYISFRLSTFAVSLYGRLAQVPQTEEWMPALAQIALFATLILLQFGGSGPASTAMNYILKKFVNDTHAWVWEDFLKSFRQNFWQSIVIYVINMLAYVLLIGSFLFYSFGMGGSMSGALRIVIVIATVFFSMMQMYVYQLLAGFELRIKDVYKNAAFLVLLSIPKNILAMIASVAVMYVLFNLAAIGGTLAVLSVMLPVVMVFFFSLTTFTQNFMTRGIVQKYMIDGVRFEDGEIVQPSQDEPIFEDATVSNQGKKSKKE